MEKDRESVHKDQRLGAPRIYQDRGQKLAFISGVYMASRIMAVLQHERVFAEKSLFELQDHIFQTFCDYQGLVEDDVCGTANELSDDHFIYFDSKQALDDFMRKAVHGDSCSAKVGDA